MKKYYLGIVSILAHNFFNPIWSLQFLSGIFWQHMLILQTSTLCKPCQLILTRENELWIMVNIKLSVLNQMTWLSLKWCRVTEKSSQVIPGQNCQENQIKETCSDFFNLIHLLIELFFQKSFHLWKLMCCWRIIHLVSFSLQNNLTN